MHTYIKVNQYFFNVEISRIKMTYLLLFKLKPFNIVDGESSSQFTPSIIIKLYRIIRFLRYMHAGVKQQEWPIIQLPLFGHLALYNRRRDSYKVFDVDQNIVTTLYPPHLTNELIDRLAYYSSIGTAGLGPQYISSNAATNSYEEEYINEPLLPLQLATSQHSRAILTEITSFLHKLKHVFPNTTINRQSYLSDKSTRVPDILLLHDGISDKLSFISGAIEHLKGILLADVAPIELTLSHGDLHSSNIVRRNKQLLALDWEFVGWRSSHYDYCFFYYKAFKRMPDMNYGDRQLFYFEYLYHWFTVLCEDCLHYSLDDIHRTADWIIKDIEYFHAYEKKNFAADKPKQKV